MTPSQEKTIQELKIKALEHMGEGFEYKRFDVYPFVSNPKLLEVFIEFGKIDETIMESISGRVCRQIWVGERGGCELANPKNPKDTGKVKGIDGCCTAEV